MIKVLLVDDHDLVRTGIRRLLDDTRGIKVVGEADSGEEALAQVRLQAPDVVIMDVTMPGIGGLEATRKLKAQNPDLKVIACTVHMDAPFPQQLLEAGAEGYLSKGTRPDEMVTAIREVAAGNRYVGADVAQQMATATGAPDSSPFEGLSRRELQVLTLVCQGRTPGEIAEQLHLSPKTISTYRYRLFDKLDVRTDAELMRLAGRYGILDGLE